MKSLLVHPDKAGNLAGAADAFGKVIDVSTTVTELTIQHPTLTFGQTLALCKDASWSCGPALTVWPA